MYQHNRGKGSGTPFLFKWEYQLESLACRLDTVENILKNKNKKNLHSADLDYILTVNVAFTRNLPIVTFTSCTCVLL